MRAIRAAPGASAQMRPCSSLGVPDAAYAVLAPVSTVRSMTPLPRFAAAALATILLAGCAGSTAPDPVAAPEAGAPAAAVAPADPIPGVEHASGIAGTAAAALEAIPVKGRAPKTGYDRDLFGAGWLDPDRNGCDTRNDILRTQLSDVTVKPGTQDCVVLSGTLADPFSGSTIAFVRGQDTSTAVQIDHVVPLSDAWQKGAQQWAPDLRAPFANDPLNLLAVDGPLNGQKSDGDAATWLPPAKEFRCEYVARQVAVKAKWGLWVTQAEKDAIGAVLATCPEQPLPADPGTVPVPGPTVTAPGEAPAEVSEPPVEEPYVNCAAARAAGAAPVHAGQPGYGPHLDADGDGVGCQ